MAKTGDVVVKVGAKADQSSIKSAIDSFDKAIDNLAKSGTKSAEFLISELEAIKASVEAGLVKPDAAREVVSLLSQSGFAAQSAATQFLQYTSALRSAASANGDLSDILGGAKSFENANAQAFKNAVDVLTSTRKGLSEKGTAGASGKIKEINAVLTAIKTNGVDPLDAATVSLVNQLEKLNESAKSGDVNITKYAKALNEARMNSDKMASAIESASKVGVQIQGKGLLSFTQIGSIAQKLSDVQEFANSVSSLIDEVTSIDPKNVGLIKSLENIRKELESGELDGDKFKVMSSNLVVAARNVKGLDQELVKKLAPHLIDIREKMNGLRPPKKLTSEGFASIASEISMIDSEAGNVINTIQRLGGHFKSLGPIMASWPFAAVLAGIGAIVAVANKFISRLKEAKEYFARMDVKTLDVSVDRINKHLEAQNALLERGNRLRDQRLSNERATEDATIALKKAQLEYNKAQELATATSDEERFRIEQKYGRMDRRMEYADNVRGINREEADTRRSIADNEKQIAEIEKTNAALEEKIRQAKQMSEKYYKLGNEQYNTDPLSLRQMINSTGDWLNEAFGMKVDGATADQIREQLNSKIEQLIEQTVSNDRKLKDLRSENLGSADKLKEGGVLDMQKKAAQIQMDAANKQNDAAVEAEKRRKMMENWGRSMDISDRDWGNRKADREEGQRRNEALYGFAARRSSVEADLNEAKQDLADDQKALKEASEQELQRLREKNPFKVFNSLADASEEELSSEFKTMRSRLESYIERDRANVRSAEGAKFDFELEGNQKQAAFMAETRKGGSRLTALGLGGGDALGFAKETANNTRAIKDILSSNIKEMKGSGGIGSMRGLGSSWTMN